jgi:hypothetical protein
LPYSLRVKVTVVELVPTRSITAEVAGDLAGVARLELCDVGDDSCEVRLWWRVDLRRPLLRAVGRVARPVLEWGHRWVIENGVERFRTVVDERAPRPTR